MSRNKASWLDEVNGLLSELSALGEPVQACPGASQVAIQGLESALGLDLPSEYREFLLRHDGLSFSGSEILGVRGARRWTTYTRERYAADSRYIVIRAAHSDDAVYALLTSRGAPDAGPVVLIEPIPSLSEAVESVGFAEWLTFELRLAVQAVHDES